MIELAETDQSASGGLLLLGRGVEKFPSIHSNVQIVSETAL